MLIAYSADTQKLLTLLPHARERLSAERFLQIASSALLHSSQLPPDDFDRVHSNVRGVLDIVVDYFSSSGINEVVQLSNWRLISDLLSACVRLAEADIARSAHNCTLFTWDIYKTLEKCALKCPAEDLWQGDVEYGINGIRDIMNYPTNSYVPYFTLHAQC